MVSMGEAANKIQQQIDKGEALYEEELITQRELDESERNYRQWNDYNVELLKGLFNTHDESKCYARIHREIIMPNATLSARISIHKKHIGSSVANLRSLLNKLELIPLSESINDTQPSSSCRKEYSSKIFIVHGHDDISKNELEIFLRSIGLEPIVLHRQADEGLTIIEKFEKHSDVGYAFILLTPDEVAYLRSEDAKPDDERKKELRARPNVIFEFGYFVGKLGRSRVCCLHTGDVSSPSDVSGMIYKRYQSNIEETGVSIMRDLKNCGIRYKA